MMQARYPFEISTPFNPVSPHAAGIAHIFTVILIASAVILAFVVIPLIYICIKFRARPGQPDPPKQFGITWLERTWTVLPFLFLMSMLGLTGVTMTKTDPAVPLSAEPDLLVIAHQWWWEFRYPKLGVVTANQLHMPAHRSLMVRIMAADVIHDFSVPRLARKIDAVPGHPVSMWLRADTPGIYPGSCNEFCGMQHAWMRLRVYAQDQTDFEAWVRHNAAPALAPVTDGQKLGQQLFLSKTCVNCHTIRGTPASGTTAPDLTHVGSRDTLGAERIENTPAKLYQWLRDTQGVKPGAMMPNMQLKEPEVVALTAYLESLK